ncbi:MAG: twin-arginine translocation signal domain-containing protein, partial [Bacteroidaceae bacterium]|nr:twin-arginine translocation signal domain-containing protein [Bacteroidaceae bacterium]
MSIGADTNHTENILNTSTMTTRRHFLRQSATALAAGLILPETMRGSNANMKVSAN